jgi:Amt family ammonium transporter
MSVFNSGDIAWMLVASAMVLFMTPGLAFFYGGFVKRKNVINMLFSSVALMGIASILWVLVGYSLSFSGDIGGIIGNLNWFGLAGVKGAAEAAPTIPSLCFAIFQMMFAIITPALISGAVAERMKFSAYLLFTVFWSLLVYYPLAHMVWGGGLLQKLGSIDFAGGDVVHISSGISALVLSIAVGKRKNQGNLISHPHNVPFILLGASILWFGWFGFNAGSAGAANETAVLAFINTNTSAASGMLSWMFIERLHNGKPTLVGAATGLVLGLVAITPGAGFVPVWSAIIIGALVSPISYFFITYVKPKFGYDDSLDAFGCHGVGGIWGGIATGIFAHTSINSAVQWNGLAYGSVTLFVRQVEAVLITVLVAVAGTLISLALVKLFIKDVRVSTRAESVGLDINEHGESAYPAFNGMEN